MLSLHRTVSWRYLGKRWFRAALIVASIALGVATLVATRALSETMNTAGEQASNPLAGTADLLVSNGENRVEMALAAELAKVEGVASAHPRIFTKVKLPDLNNQSALLLGIDLTAELKRESSAAPFEVKDENLFAAALFAFGKSAFVGRELVRALGDRPIRVQPRGELPAVQVSRAGTIEAGGQAAVLAGHALVMDVRAVGKLLGYEPGGVDRIDIVLAEGVSRERVKEAVQAVLGGRAEVYTPDEQNQIVRNVFAGMQAGFSMCGTAALVVGLFLVYNALAVSVAERRHEIGILLALGATRGQVRRLFAGEAALLGLAGAALGIPLGLGLAHLGLQPVQDVLRDIFMALDAQQVRVTPAILVLAVVAGVATAVLAALVPAIQASAENPAEAVRRIPPRPGWHGRALQVVGSVALVGAGVVLTHFRHELPPRLGIYGGMTVFLLGLLLAIPLLAAVAARILRPGVRFVLGLEGRLAADNLVRAPGRTGLVIAALAAGVALVLQTAGVIRSNRVAVRQWIDETIGAGLFVTSGSPVGAGGQNEPMRPELARELAKIPGVRAALPVRSKLHYFGDTKVLVLALDVAGINQYDTTDRPIHRLYRELEAQPDGVLVSENFQALHGVRPGDTVTLSGPVTLKVVGTTVDYSWNHGTLIVRRDEFLRHWRDTEVDIFDVYLDPAADPLQVKETINHRLAAGHDLVMQTRGELQAHIDGMIERLYGIAYAQLVVVMCVAALGVVTALLISVLQRRREMGLLRAVGASQAQVVRSVLAEAALMGVIGTLLGVAVGVPIEWYVLRVVILEETGYLFPVHVPWAESLVIAAAALALATLAGLGPALYAVRQRIPEAIAYE